MFPAPSLSMVKAGPMPAVPPGSAGGRDDASPLGWLIAGRVVIVAGNVEPRPRNVVHPPRTNQMPATLTQPGASRSTAPNTPNMSESAGWIDQRLWLPSGEPNHQPDHCRDESPE